MNINKLQKIVNHTESIIEKKMGKFQYSNLIRCLKSQEELGEVADILVRIEVGSRKGKISLAEGKKKLGEEIVDVIVPLIGLANFYDIDLSPIFEKKFKRDKERYKKD
jgi:NTP pyrophosphatase (non-canonical NTP hydrolase)